MLDRPDNSQSLSRFLDFINNQLDLNALGEVPPLTDAEIEHLVMPLIRDDIHQETLKLVAQLLRAPQPDYWRAQLAPFHREVRGCLAQALAALMQQRFSERMSADDWLDASTFLITVAWLVRKQMDADDPPLPGS